MSVGAEPELNQTPLLQEADHKQYQHIVGVCQWLIGVGQFDICYAVNSLSRFSMTPREGHLKLARELMGYLRKHPNRGYIINPNKPKFDLKYQTVLVKEDYGYQYSYSMRTSIHVSQPHY